MNKSINVFCAGAALFGLGALAWTGETPPASAPAMHHTATAEGAKSAPTDEELIASAMKAAPKKVAENATERWDAYPAQRVPWLHLHA
jgi:hypothetical protein